MFVTWAYQDAPEPPMTPELRKRAERSVLVITDDGQVLKAARAILFTLEHLGWGSFARLLSYPPLIWFAEVGYKIVASIRKWL